MGNRFERLARGVLDVALWPFACVARARGWRKAPFIGLEFLLAAACGFGLWWWTGALELPDIGDPFDVALYRSERIAPGLNAFEVWREASAKYLPRPRELPQAASRGLPGFAPPPVAWLDSNKEALDLFIRGAALPDALAPRPDPSPGGLKRSGEAVAHAVQLISLALDEGLRRHQAAEFEGAARCYVAAFRGLRLVARRGTKSDREVALGLWKVAQERFHPLVEDERTPYMVLRRSLDDLNAMATIVPDDTVAVRAMYLEFARVLSTPGNRWEQFDPGYPKGPDEWDIVRLLRSELHPLRRWRAREGERSQRVLKLLTAEWLAYFSDPPDQRPPPSIRVVYRIPWGTFFVDCFEAGYSAPPTAHAATPEQVARAFSKTFDARNALVLFWTELSSLRNRERQYYSSALITVAEVLYRRDHEGQAPVGMGELLGVYLKEIPFDPSVPTADDDTPPEIEGDQ